MYIAALRLVFNTAGTLSSKQECDQLFLTTVLSQVLLHTSYLGRLLKGQASLNCFDLLVLLVAAAEILAVKAGTYNHTACLPSQPACLVCAWLFGSCFVEVDFFAN